MCSDRYAGLDGQWEGHLTVDDLADVMTWIGHTVKEIWGGWFLPLMPPEQSYCRSVVSSVSGKVVRVMWPSSWFQARGLVERQAWPEKRQPSLKTERAQDEIKVSSILQNLPCELWCAKAINICKDRLLQKSNLIWTKCWFDGDEVDIRVSYYWEILSSGQINHVAWKALICKLVRLWESSEARASFKALDRRALLIGRPCPNAAKLHSQDILSRFKVAPRK